MGSKPHILVFGGTGRLGPDLVHHLMQGATVTLFSRRIDLDLPPPHHVIQCDVRDPVATAEGIQYALAMKKNGNTRPLGILYMATEGIGKEYGRRIDDEFEVAVVGLASVVRAVASHMPTPQQVAVVFASSLAVLTHPAGGLEYEVGKAAGEQYCRHMAANPPTEGWRFNVLRIGRVSLAPELKPAVAQLAGFLLGGSSRGISGQVFSASSPASE